MNNLLFEGKADIKENLRIKLQEIGIDDSPETSEYFNKIRDLLGFTQEKVDFLLFLNEFSEFS